MTSSAPTRRTTATHPQTNSMTLLFAGTLVIAFVRSSTLVWSGGPRRPRRRQESFYLRRITFEGISHHEKITAIARNRIPIDHVRLIAFLKPGNGLGATGRASIRRWMIACLIPAHTVVPFADSFRWVDSKEQSFRRVDIVIFEVQTMQPGIVTGE